MIRLGRRRRARGRALRARELSAALATAEDERAASARGSTRARPSSTRRGMRVATSPLGDEARSASPFSQAKERVASLQEEDRCSSATSGARCRTSAAAIDQESLALQALYRCARPRAAAAATRRRERRARRGLGAEAGAAGAPAAEAGKTRRERRSSRMQAAEERGRTSARADPSPRKGPAPRRPSRRPTTRSPRATRRRRRTRAKAAAATIAPLSEADCPDGFVTSLPPRPRDRVGGMTSAPHPPPPPPPRPFRWTSSCELQKLRVAKMQKEIEIERASAEASDLKAQLAELGGGASALGARIGASEEAVGALTEASELAERNTEALVLLKQGQDEVEQDAVVTDYGGAMLVPVGVIDEVNTEITRLGGEQVKILNKIKNFRKSINLMEWEDTYATTRASDLEEHHRTSSCCA